MGNALSEEEQEQIMEEAYNLEDPEADKKLNSGTSAPNCQPKHTQRDEQNNGSQQEGADNNNSSRSLQEGHQQPPGLRKNERSSSTMSVREAQEDRRKRQHTNTTTQSASASSSSQSSLSSQQQEQQEISSAAAQQQKKLSYFQMARLGYQELVNAIIRPPRADYKVRTVIDYIIYYKLCTARCGVVWCHHISDVSIYYIFSNQGR